MKDNAYQYLEDIQDVNTPSRVHIVEGYQWGWINLMPSSAPWPKAKIFELSADCSPLVRNLSARSQN